MASDTEFEEIIQALRGCVEFYEQNDDGSGEPFMNMGFPRESVEAFQRAKKVLEKHQKGKVLEALEAAYSALKDIVNAADNNQPYGVGELMGFVPDALGQIEEAVKFLGGEI